MVSEWRRRGSCLISILSICPAISPLCPYFSAHLSPPAHCWNRCFIYLFLSLILSLYLHPVWLHIIGPVINFYGILTMTSKIHPLEVVIWFCFLCVLRPVLQATRINSLSRACPLPAPQCMHHCSTSNLGTATLLLHMLAHTVLQHQLHPVCVQSASSIQSMLLATHLQVCSRPKLQQVFQHQLCHSMLHRATKHQATNSSRQQQQALWPFLWKSNRLAKTVRPQLNNRLTLHQDMLLQFSNRLQQQQPPCQHSRQHKATLLHL